jgi:hypothetical protein
MTLEPNVRQEYLSYLLRLWRASGDDGKPVWRATLETPVTRETFNFTDLQTLFAYLKTRTSEVEKQ